MKKQSLAELANVSLAKWTVRKVVEVYKTDTGGEGHHVKTLGWFFDHDLAKAFRGQQADSAFCAMRFSWALVDPSLQRGFLLKESGAEFNFIDEAKVRKGVKARALEKLTPAERRTVART